MAIGESTPPELEVVKWLNTKNRLSLESLRGKVVAVFAFQMLCPGCVEHFVPQAKRINTLFNDEDLTVIGLHTVFEHHLAMTEVSLRAFLHEYKIEFPVGIDMPSDNPNDPLPKTMRTYEMAGTPTLLLYDRKGNLRKHTMGHIQDLVLGAELMSLMRE